MDQRGNFVAEPGHFVGVVGDPRRDQFYVLDRLNYRVIAYDHSMRVIGTFRTGNTPTWMALERGDSVKLSGFGNFQLRDKPQRPGRNPKTGEEIPITARRVVTFHASQKLKAAVEQLSDASKQP